MSEDQQKYIEQNKVAELQAAQLQPVADSWSNIIDNIEYYTKALKESNYKRGIYGEPDWNEIKTYLQELKQLQPVADEDYEPDIKLSDISKPFGKYKMIPIDEAAHPVPSDAEIEQMAENYAYEYWRGGHYGAGRVGFIAGFKAALQYKPVPPYGKIELDEKLNVTSAKIIRKSDNGEPVDKKQ